MEPEHIWHNVWNLNIYGAACSSSQVSSHGASLFNPYYLPSLFIRFIVGCVSMFFSTVLLSYWITLCRQFSKIKIFFSPFFLCPFAVLTCWASQRKSRCSPWTHLLWCRDPKKDISAAVGHTLHQLVLDPKTIWKQMLLVTWLETAKHMLAK